MTFVRKCACALSVRWRTQQHQARAVGEDNSLQPLKVHCLKQTAEPSLCSNVGVCLGIVSAGVCVREMLFSCPARDVPNVEAWRHGADRCGST